jgi:hypothetical protein
VFLSKLANRRSIRITDAMTQMISDSAARRSAAQKDDPTGRSCRGGQRAARSSLLAAAVLLGARIRGKAGNADSITDGHHRIAHGSTSELSSQRIQTVTAVRVTLDPTGSVARSKP